MSQLTDLTNAVALIKADSEIYNAILHGPSTGEGSTVETEGGDLPTFAKVLSELASPPLQLTTVPNSETESSSLLQPAIVSHSDDTFSVWDCVKITAPFEWLPRGDIKYNRTLNQWERGFVLAGTIQTEILPDQ